MKANVRVAWITLICVIMQIVLPILSYADSGIWKMETADGLAELSIIPYENEMGLMVDASDAAKVFSFDYESDSVAKTFTIEDESHGKVVLMHKATEFISGENIYECAPYFYYENGVPMVEMGFFCAMFGASYEKEENTIRIEKDSLGDNVPKLIIDEEVTPLYFEPYKNELGLIAEAEKLATAFGLSYTFNENDNSVIFNDETQGTVTLNDRAEAFVSDAGEFGCKPYYFVENGTAFIEVGFFCEMYGASYEYDEDTKALTVIKDVPMNFEETEIPGEITPNSVSTLSASVQYFQGAPANGLNVKLIIQCITTRYSTYYGYTYSVEKVVNVGNLTFNPGETYKNLVVDIDSYNTGGYDKYTVYFEETDAEAYGYYNESNNISKYMYSPLSNYTYYNYSKLFSFGTDNSIVLNIDNAIPTISGKINLEENCSVPANGLDVNLVLQVRGAIYTRTSLYGGTTSTYSRGGTYTLGTTHFDKGETSKEYKYILSPYQYSYPFYMLFYTSPDSSCIEPYGYYSSDGTVTVMDESPFNSTKYYIEANEFMVSQIAMVDITIPAKDSAVIPGDANGDGDIDFTDAIAVLKHDAGTTLLSGDKLTAADANGDGEVDFVDAILILKYDSGLISSFD